MINFWQKNLTGFFLIILFIITINWQDIYAAYHHTYYINEQDAYMHLLMASNLLKHPDWYQHFMPRVNAPSGCELHSWTQVISFILVSGAYLLKWIMPQSSALYLWACIVPMLYNALAAMGMIWAIKFLKPDPYQQLFIILAFLTNPFLKAFFSPLMVNYDFLLITLGIVYWGYLLRVIATKKITSVIPVAITASLGIWTSISFIMIVFTGLAYLVWLAIIKSDIQITIISTLLATICLILALVIRLEHALYFTVSHDIISIVHLTFFILLFIGAMIYSIFMQQSGKMPTAIVILFMAVSIFMIMNYLFPGFYRGPYNNLDPWLLTHFFPVISKFLSPFIIDNTMAIAMLCYSFIGFGYFYYLHICKCSLEPPISLLLWATLVTTALTALMYRWSEFSIPLTILLVSFFVAKCCTRKQGTCAKILIVSSMAFLPSIIFLWAKPYSPAHLKCQQQFHNMITDGFLEKPEFSNDKTIFIHSNHGPLILFATHFSIIATNDHHNPDGVRDTFDFFKVDEQQARNILSKRKTDLVLLCQSQFATRFDPGKSSWLNSLPLPDKYNLWQLYKLKR